jgi:hypothetical protein
MKKQTQKDKKIRKFFNQQELNHIILKSIVRNGMQSLDYLLLQEIKTKLDSSTDVF